MAGDMKEVVERAERALAVAGGVDSAVVRAADLRALLSAHRKMVEALEKIADHYSMLTRITDGRHWGAPGERPSQKTTIAAIRTEVIAGEAFARAALTGSREHAD